MLEKILAVAIFFKEAFLLERLSTNKVQSISASNLKISNTSTIHPSAFFSRGFFISGLSSNSGYRQIGTCYIPSDVNVVRVKSTGLKAFFYNRDFWIRMGELNGTISL